MESIRWDLPLTHTTNTARDLTLEAARDAGPRRPTRPLPAAQIKKLLDSRHEKEVLDGLRRVVAVCDDHQYHSKRHGPRYMYCIGEYVLMRRDRCNMPILPNPP